MRGAAGPRDLMEVRCNYPSQSERPRRMASCGNPAQSRRIFSPPKSMRAGCGASRLVLIRQGRRQSTWRAPRPYDPSRKQRVLLRGLALAEMRTLHDQIAGSNFLIAFATPEGLLLDIVADKSFADTPEAKNIRPGKSLVGNALRHKRHRHGRVPQAPGRRPRQRALFPEFRFTDLRCISDFRAGWFTSGHPRRFVRLRLSSDPHRRPRLHGHNPDRERAVS